MFQVIHKEKIQEKFRNKISQFYAFCSMTSAVRDAMENFYPNYS